MPDLYCNGSGVVRFKVQISTPISLGLSWEWGMSIHRQDKVQGIHMNIYFLKIPLWKNSQVAYFHHPYKMSHLNSFPCPTFSLSIKGRVQIPTLSTFPSKPYEPRDMKGNFGKFLHWDTSESLLWKQWSTTNRHTNTMIAMPSTHQPIGN